MKKHKEILLNTKRVCIFRTDGIGDMILTLPMVNVIKKINPCAKIDFIISNRTLPLLNEQPLIHKTYLIENMVKLPCFLKDKRYDVVFFPRPKPKEVLASFVAKIPLRVGSAYRLYSLLLNHRVKEHRKYGKLSEAQHNLNLISSITGEYYSIELIPPVVQKEFLTKVIDKFNLPSNFIIVHPGGAGSAPKLPIDKFVEIAKILSEKYNRKIIITGNDPDLQDNNIISENNPNTINLSGKTSLEELIAVIHCSDGVIANSTGVIHIAASFDKKIIGFYPNSPSMNATRWGPISDKKAILTPKTNNQNDLDNMNLISTDSIEKAYLELFIS